MPHDPITVGYAQAFFEMARAEQVVPRVEEELFRLRELLKTNPALLQFLRNPGIQREGKRQALAELFAGRVQPLVLNLLLTLNDLDRTGRLLNVIEEFGALAAAARQQVNGELTTALRLDEATVGRLAAELSRTTGKSVQLFQKVDPAILGGAIVKIGDEVIDGSLRRKLNQLKELLVK